MTAKEYLQQIRQCEIFIKQRQRELEQLKDSRTFISGIDYGKDRVQTSFTGGTSQNKTSEDIVDLENEIEENINKMNSLRHDIIDKIQKMKDIRYSELLFLKYVEGMDLGNISIRMNYEYKWCCELHTRALDEFAECFL